jgi:autoinducer 2-degrading protein
MIAMWVKTRVKPTERERFLKAIEEHTLASERDEPGCVRFNVLQDAEDPDIYYLLEIFRDEAALEAHRATPHLAAFQAADTLLRPSVRTFCKPVFPAAPEYWGKR